MTDPDSIAIGRAATASPPDATTELARGVNVDLSDALVRAVVASFSQPTITFAPQWVPNPNGMGGQQVMEPQFGASPLSSVTSQLWSVHGQEITRRVIETIDVPDLAEKIASKVTDKLKEDGRDRGGWRPNSSDDLHKQVRDRLADKLSDRALADYDREQQEMRAAWVREQERARQAQLEAGAEDDDTEDGATA